ncbi:hypothetical protein J3R82DRAFT_10132 [Butyriboletus roseoflavus]|nr:hypothetical protein J3R82DRAFT_10132 [Butyriboletus roseoflavus]
MANTQVSVHTDQSCFTCRVPRASMKHLIDFHIKVLLKLVADQLEIQEAVQLLYDSTEAGEDLFLYHLNYLKNLAPNYAQIIYQPEFTETVDILQHGIRAFNAGLDLDVLLYHLDCLKSVVPNDADICREVKILTDCISWKASLDNM